MGAPGSHMCGGSLGGSNIVISAAHCVLAPDRVVVAYGTNNWADNDNLMYVKEFIAHPNYAPARVSLRILKSPKVANFNFTENNQILIKLFRKFLAKFREKGALGVFRALVEISVCTNLVR